MARGFNKVLLMGNLTRDVELRHTSSNQAVANIGLAVNRSWRTPEGETREEVTFVDCEAWGKTAETLSKFLSKGRPVFIEGRLKLDTWQDKEGGGNRSKLKVVVEDFRFIDAKGEGGGGGGGRAAGGDRGAAPARGSGSGEPEYANPPEDDIPF